MQILDTLSILECNILQNDKWPQVCAKIIPTEIPWCEQKIVAGSLT